MSEDRTRHEGDLDEVIEGNNNIFSRLATLENKIGAMISLYKDVVIDQSHLEARVRALEQRSDYPNEKELKELKIGGTD